MISSARPSLKYSFSLSELMLTNGSTAMEGACFTGADRDQTPEARDMTPDRVAK